MRPTEPTDHERASNRRRASMRSLRRALLPSTLLAALASLPSFGCGAPASPEAAESTSSAATLTSFAAEYAMQPGWVRATFNLSTTDNVTASASVTCGSGSPSSVTTQISTLPNHLVAVDVNANLPWLAANGLPLPCAVTGITLTYHTVPTFPGGVSVSTSATAPAHFQMDLPLAYLTPQNLGVQTIAGASVGLAPPASSRRYAAYPPQIVAIASSGGRTAFVEIEERLDRGTLGIRAMSAFLYGSIERELGGGAEVFDGWGLDIDTLGVTKTTAGTEESNAGHNEFSGGGFPPAFLADPDPLVFPAPPLFPLSTYQANVLDNHGVPRCFSAGGCLDVIYDATAHTLRAINGAQLALVESGPIGGVGSMPASQSTTLPPAFTPPAGTSKSGQGPVAPKTKATGVYRAQSCALSGTTVAGPLTLCGGASAAISCPTPDDPIDPDTLPSSGSGAQLSLSKYMPYYANRRNIYGDCASHMAAQYTEYLYNRLAADAMPQAAATVDGQTVAIPTVPIAFSPSGGGALTTSSDGLKTGTGTDNFTPTTGHGNHPHLVPDAYWPARSPDWANWNAKARGIDGDLCSSIGFFTSSYCMGQGAPPPGAYWNYAQQVMSLGNNVFTADVFGLAESYLDDPETAMPHPDFTHVISALQSGLPVMVAMRGSAYSDVIDSSGHTWNLLAQGMSWFLPPELAACSTVSLDAVIKPAASHAVNIVGYELTMVPGTTTIDPVSSYFIIENNWGKDAGYRGFYTMNFSAFEYLAPSTTTMQLNCDYESPACSQPMTSYTFNQLPGVTNAVDVGDDGYHVNFLGMSTDTRGNWQEYSWSHEHAYSSYTAVPGQQLGLAMDVGAYGPWVVNAAGSIYGSIKTATGVTYGQVGGNATDIGVSPDGNTVYAVGVTGSQDGSTGHAIFKWLGPSGGSNPWVQMIGQYGVRIDAANDGSAWVTTNAGAIWHVSGSPASPTSSRAGGTGSLASDITVGNYGDVFVVGAPPAGQPIVKADYPLYHYDAQTNGFGAIGGSGWRISAGISPEGVSVANAEGQIWTTERVYLH